MQQARQAARDSALRPAEPHQSVINVQQAVLTNYGGRNLSPLELAEMADAAQNTAAQQQLAAQQQAAAAAQQAAQVEFSARVFRI